MIEITNTNEYINIGGANYLKNASLKWEKQESTPREKRREHKFLLYGENEDGEQISTGLYFSAVFSGVLGETETSTNVKGTFTDGETEDYDILDDDGNPTGEIGQRLIVKDIIPFVLGGGDLKDVSVSVISFGWADFVNSKKYFMDSEEDSDFVDWSNNIANEIITEYDLSDDYTSEQILLIQDQFFYMAQEAFLERLKINGLSLKQQGFQI